MFILLLLFSSHTKAQGCDDGFYGISNNETSGCMPCPEGSYGTSNATQIIDCELCPSGTYSAVSGAANVSFCLPCPPGSYGENAGATSLLFCTLCPLGTFQNVSGADSIDSCSSCPTPTDNTTYLFLGANSAIQCQASTKLGTNGQLVAVITALDSPAPSPAPGVSSAVISGVAVGGLALIGLSVGIIVLVRRRKNKRMGHETPSQRKSDRGPEEEGQEEAQDDAESPPSIFLHHSSPSNRITPSPQASLAAYPSRKALPPLVAPPQAPAAISSLHPPSFVTHKVSLSIAPCEAQGPPLIVSPSPPLTIPLKSHPEPLVSEASEARSLEEEGTTSKIAPKLTRTAFYDDRLTASNLPWIHPESEVAGADRGSAVELERSNTRTRRNRFRDSMSRNIDTEIDAE